MGLNGEIGRRKRNEISKKFRKYYELKKQLSDIEIQSNNNNRRKGRIKNGIMNKKQWMRRKENEGR